MVVSPVRRLGVVSEHSGSRDFWGDVPALDLGVGCPAESCLRKSIKLCGCGRCSLVMHVILQENTTFIEKE